jgi:sarcosine oxidase
VVYDAIVAGLGSMGSATLARAALRGMRVAGFERFERGHALGASSGATRMIRQAYFEDPAYVPLLLRAYELWRDLEGRTATELLDLVGVLIVGLPESVAVAGAQSSARLHGLAIERLDAAEIARRYPPTRPRPDEIGVLERNAGVVFPERAVEAHLRVAEDAGATLVFGRGVTGWSAHGDALRVALDDGTTVLTRKLALCQGPWMQAEFVALGIPLAVQRNVQFWFQSDPSEFGPSRLPGFLVDRADLPAPLYGFPDFGSGLKAALHGYGVQTAPDALEREVTREDFEPVQRALAQWLPGAAKFQRSAKACMYSLTSDEHFVIGAHPAGARVVLAGGFSGHGFKFSSVVGEIVSDLLADGATRHDIAFLSPTRFAN